MTDEEVTSQNLSFTVSSLEDSSVVTLTNPFSEDQQTSARSEGSTPLPDMESITPVPSLERRKKKCKNPFLDDGAVVNPFMNYDVPKEKVRVKSRQSVKSSTSTLFDDSNPFKVKVDKTPPNIVVKPKPPNRTSSLLKSEEIVITLEEDLGITKEVEAQEEICAEMTSGELLENVDLSQSVKSLSKINSVTDADCGEFQCPITERHSPEGFSASAEPNSADTRTEFIGGSQLDEISDISQDFTDLQQLESSQESRSNISVTTEHNLHLMSLSSQVQQGECLQSQFREAFSNTFQFVHICRSFKALKRLTNP